ncbi:MAG TPA: adenylosuccinate lyase [Armatimonadota bacterium]|jgi:adenylosuccinate lyase
MIDRYSLPDMAAIWSEDNKFRKWLDVELAVSDALAEIGEIPAEAARIQREKGRVDAAEIAEIEKTTDHDVIAFIKCATRDMGEAESYFHHGVTSTDIVDTAQALQLSEACDLLIADVQALETVLVRRAREHKTTLQIGRTHGVHGEPVTFGLKLAVWIAEVRRSIDRLQHARKGITVGQLSGAVGTYANIDPRVETLACRALGLEPSPASTQTLQRDRHAELLTTFAVVGGSLEKFATEIRNLQRTDILEAEEYFKPGQRGSSAMPHKRNPITAERVAGMARLLRGYAVTAMENQSLWHERDITHSSAERVILPDACLCLHYMLRKFTDVMDRLIVYPANMMRNVERTKGLVVSQRVMLALTEKGMSREDSYKAVQRNALAAWNGESDFRANLEADPEVMARVTSADLDELFDYTYFTRHLGVVFDRLGI